MIVIFILKYIIYFLFFAIYYPSYSNLNIVPLISLLCKSAKAQAEANTQLYQIHVVDNEET